MPPQSGPSLTVQASPVNTYVAAAAPAVALYDQQQVAMAQQLVSAFSDLSVTAARFAGSMKAEQNEEDIKAGMDLVNKSRKSYQKLVESGEIKPTENPWMAVGAQQASGTLEGMRARADFERIYALKASEDPKFFDNPEAFDALAAQYVQNANVNLGDASYQTRAFYEAFNPYIASKAMQHEEAIAKHREERILIGVQAGVSKALQDSLSPSQAVRDDAMTGLKDLLSTPQGVSLQRVNQAVIATFVDALEESDNPDHVMAVFSEVSAGTGKLIDTQDAKAALGKAKAAIERNRDRLTREESVQFDNWLNNELIPTAFDENLTDEQVRERLDTYFAGPDRKITVTAQEMESKKAYAFSQLNTARKEAERQLKEQTDAAINEAIQGAAMEEDFDKGLQKVESVMDRLGVATEQRWMFEGAYEKLHQRYSGRREDRRVQQAEQFVWKGIEGNPGLDIVAAEETRRFFARPEDADIQQQGLNAFASRPSPKFDQYKQRYDDFLISVGITPDTDKARTAYKNAYSRLDRQIDLSMQERIQNEPRWGGTALPSANDTPDVLAAKSALRAQSLMMKMHLAQTFDDRRVVSDSVNGFLNSLNPQAVESGDPAQTYRAVDLIQAYAFARQNNLQLDLILPTGENGKALRESLATLSMQVMSGQNMDDVLRDFTSRKFFGETVKVSELAMKSNVIGWTDMVTGNGEDAVDFRNTYDATLAGMLDKSGQPLVSDSGPYAASFFQMAYFRSLAQNKSAKQAVTQAAQELKDSHFVVNNSLIPRAGLSSGVDENYIKAWLKYNYPDNADATLVVVSLEPTGAPIFAVRDQDGNALVQRKNGRFESPRLWRPLELEQARSESKFLEAIKKEEQEDLQRRMEIRRGLGSRPELAF